MRVSHISQLKAGNPFNDDTYHMGTQLGSNCVAMFAKHTNEEQAYVIIVDTTTGDRVLVELKPKG